MIERLRAYEVLRFCEMIEESLAHTEFEDDMPEWRIYWIAGVASLRTVGQVLDKVDAASDPDLRSIVDQKWRELKSNKDRSSIFWEFIEPERDNLLKEFGFGAAPADATVTTFSWEHGGERVTTYKELFYGSDGRFAISIFSEAIDFWRAYLDDVAARWASTTKRESDRNG